MLPIPESLTLSAGTRALILKGLLAKGLLTERAARDNEPTALVISPAGLDAAGVLPDSAPVQPEAVAEAPKPRRKAKSRRVGERAAKPVRVTKQSSVIAMLRQQNGASIEEIADATDWAPHSVRGFMSGTLKKRLGLVIISEKGADGIRRYFVGALKPSEG